MKKTFLAIFMVMAITAFGANLAQAEKPVIYTGEDQVIQTRTNYSGLTEEDILGVAKKEAAKKDAALRAELFGTKGKKGKPGKAGIIPSLKKEMGDISSNVNSISSRTKAVEGYLRELEVYLNEQSAAIGGTIKYAKGIEVKADGAKKTADSANTKANVALLIILLITMMGGGIWYWKRK